MSKQRPDPRREDALTQAVTPLGESAGCSDALGSIPNIQLCTGGGCHRRRPTQIVNPLADGLTTRWCTVARPGCLRCPVFRFTGGPMGVGEPGALRVWFGAKCVSVSNTWALFGSACRWPCAASTWPSQAHSQRGWCATATRVTGVQAAALEHADDKEQRGCRTERPPTLSSPRMILRIHFMVSGVERSMKNRMTCGERDVSRLQAAPLFVVSGNHCPWLDALRQSASVSAGIGQVANMVRCHSLGIDNSCTCTQLWLC